MWMFNLKKKKREEEEREKERKAFEDFKKNLVYAIKKIGENEKYFESIYETRLDAVGVNKNELDLICEQLPEAKERFSMACEDLLKVSKTNICFMENPAENVSNIDENRINHDIIEALPIMARLYREQVFLYKKLYRELFADKIVYRVNGFLFGNFIRVDEVSDEEFQSSNRAVEAFLELEINDVIRVGFGLDKDVDVTKISNPTVVKYIEYAKQIEEEENLYMEFLQSWVSQTQKIGRKYGMIHLELYEYFKDMNEKIETEIPWFSSGCLTFPQSYLSLKDGTEEECLRVLELYKNGTLSGKYYSFNDPKYRT
ncbi:MAG: hypothetical protein E7678_06010 [Ruminococcaceae bacterium]|nr:hypothetical protein [Oscillospiraceae bacterium]